MPVILIGIDDTDNDTSAGTGRLARMLSAECKTQGMRPLGVTRHQFLLDDAIPYTSHNSGACVALAADVAIEHVTFAFDFVAARCAAGSDPGVCIVRADDVTTSIVEFAQAAAEKILEMRTAFELAAAATIRLHGLGGSCQGVIGALASVGARAEGNSGRFIDLPGLRELPHRVHADTFKELNILVEHRTNGRRVDRGDAYETLDWLRPRLIGGKPVLIVEWSETKNAWLPLDRKRH